MLAPEGGIAAPDGSGQAGYVGKSERRSAGAVAWSRQRATAEFGTQQASDQREPITLRARRPGHAVMQQCLQVQSSHPPRTRAQRFWGVDPLAPAARSWFKGVRGERRVGVELELLGPDFTVLHAVPIGRAGTDVDHIVIGPTGVFSINSKNHSGRRVFVGGNSFMVGAQRTSNMRASLSEGTRATKLLSDAASHPVLVQPLLVVVADQIKRGSTPTPVMVLTPSSVRRWILSRRRVHSAEAVRYLSMVAEERATWHADALVVDDTLRVTQGFDRLEREVDAARQRRRTMAGAIVLTVIGLPLAALGVVSATASILLGWG